jgi:hypothetical protein
MYPPAVADDSNQLVARDALLPDGLEERVRAWAESQLLKRSEAIRTLVEVGLAVIEAEE